MSTDVVTLPTAPTAGALTCAALAFHGPHEVVGSLLAVQGLQQVKHIVVKHEMDQVEGACRRIQESTIR